MFEEKKMIHICGKVNCIPLPIPYRALRGTFDTDYSYMFNLNPNPDKGQQLDKLFKYFEKKKYDYWLCRCISANGFLHYHGMLKLNNINVTKIESIKKAINKQVNLYIGRAYPLERPDSFRQWYDYIHGPTNNIEQEYIYKSQIIPSSYISSDSSRAGEDLSQFGASIPVPNVTGGEARGKGATTRGVVGEE